MNFTLQHKQDGFSFMELVIAITILGILASVGYLGYSTFVEGARKTTTETNLKTIKNAVGLFKMQLNAYPSRLNDLVERPKGDIGKKWSGQFIEGKIAQDGWGNDFFYKLTPSGKRPYELYSFGSNGPEAGTPEERIDVWSL